MYKRQAHLLEPDQRNEIATELTKGLEVGEYAFSKYIPIYLGEFALWLKPQELDELISRLEVLLSSPSDNIVEVALDTVGILLQCYSDYQERFPEDSAVYEAREHRLLGMLLKGLSSYRLAVRQEARLVIGKDLFASERMSHQDVYKRQLKEFANFKKSTSIKDRLIEINRLEEDGDEIYIEGNRELYVSCTDPMTIYAWSATYTRLEKCLSLIHI